MNLDRTWERGEYLVSTERARLDVDAVYGFLMQAYWLKGTTRALVEKSLAYSLPFGVYHGTQQVGLARVISDYATFAYVSDVFIAEEYRSRGLSLWLLECIVEHPELQGLRRWLLLTKEAHDLYRKVGFTAPALPERIMERR